MICRDVRFTMYDVRSVNYGAAAPRGEDGQRTQSAYEKSAIDERFASFIPFILASEASGTQTSYIVLRTSYIQLDKSLICRLFPSRKCALCRSTGRMERAGHHARRIRSRSARRCWRGSRSDGSGTHHPHHRRAWSADPRGWRCPRRAAHRSCRSRHRDP